MACVWDTKDDMGNITANQQINWQWYEHILIIGIDFEKPKNLFGNFRIISVNILANLVSNSFELAHII